MQKLRIFLLVGSLVMLLPFDINMNIISNAMALNMISSMNNDEQDLLKKYEKFYKDDSFREAYYNYHKQHHQHHHQQQIEKEVSQSGDYKQQQQKTMTDSLIQQLTSQQSPLSISQDQMHQQQIVQLKQFLETVR
jgi:hypothetical protein